MCLTRKLSPVTSELKIYSLKMLQQTLSLSFPILSFMFSLLPVSTADSNVYVHCSQLNFTPMTPYESNVNSLFTSLVDSASVYNFNKFETSPQKDGVYGLFQCRGDLSSPNCKDCVASAITQLKTTCHMSTGGEIQLEGCFVKYDDAPFFGAQDKMEVWKKCGPSIGYNSDVLNRVEGALAYLTDGNGQYFREGDFGSIHGVAQCVQDLSLSDCQDCLSEASGRLRSECVTSTWGDMYLGKCYIRYADQGNGLIVYNGNSPPNNDSNNDDGGSNDDLAKWIGYIVGALSAGVGATLAVNSAINNINMNKNANKMTANFFHKDLEKTKDEIIEKTTKKLDDAKKEVGEAMRNPPPHPYFPVMPPPPNYNYPHHDSGPNQCSVM